MENNSFLVKLTKSKLAFITLLIVIILSNIASNYIINLDFLEFGPKFVVKAISLNGNATEFIPFSKLDSFDIETIFDSNTSVQINYQKYTEINQLVRLYETYNVEDDNNYYRLEFDFENDTHGSPNIHIFLMIILSTISLISSIAIILIIIIVIVNVFGIIRRTGIH